jgi:hypothetical protein
MKLLLLPVTILALCAMAEAGSSVVTLSGGSGRRDRNMYRPIPRGQSVNPNASASERSRSVQYQPTQHYYLRDNVVSYRYGAGSGARFGGTSYRAYLGPHGAEFTPSEDQLSPHAGTRQYAAVHKRPQPGVPMINRGARTVKTDVARTKTGESRLQLADRR